VSVNRTKTRHEWAGSTYCPPIQRERHLAYTRYYSHGADTEEPESEQNDEDACHSANDPHDVAVRDGVLGKSVCVENIGSLHTKRDQSRGSVTRRPHRNVHSWSCRRGWKGARHKPFHEQSVSVNCVKTQFSFFRLTFAYKGST
jgi:hypothetical protein